MNQAEIDQENEADFQPAARGAEQKNSSQWSVASEREAGEIVPHG